MNVSITPELENLIAAKVRTGMYTSASEVVREGLRLLSERDELRARKLEALQIEIQKGIDDMEGGRMRDGAEVMAAFRAQLLSQKQDA